MLVLQVWIINVHVGLMDKCQTPTAWAELLPGPREGAAADRSRLVLLGERWVWAAAAPPPAAPELDAETDVVEGFDDAKGRYAVPRTYKDPVQPDVCMNRRPLCCYRSVLQPAQTNSITLCAAYSCRPRGHPRTAASHQPANRNDICQCAAPENQDMAGDFPCFVYTCRRLIDLDLPSLPSGRERPLGSAAATSSRKAPQKR